MADPALRKRLLSNEFFYAPGVFDMMSALMAKEIGFDAVYASGYWLTASYLGLPDAGLSTLTDMVNRVSKVVEVSSAPVIADADTGFGGLLNVRHCVQQYEAAGVTAIQIEDQEFPKKCGHTPYKRVIPTTEMQAKIAVALDARTSEDFLIIARTDARAGEGFNSAVERGQAYAETGADLIFVEALESEDEMRRCCATIQKPQIANMATGGQTPILSNAQLQEVGYAAAIYPGISALAAIQATHDAYASLKTRGDGNVEGVPFFDFMRFCRILGFEDVWSFEEQWKDVLGPPGS